MAAAIGNSACAPGRTDFQSNQWQRKTESGLTRAGHAGTEGGQICMLVVSTLKPDKFEPTVIDARPDYLYVEYKSPFFGFIDDVEFFFSGRNDEVEYRSASRAGASDFDINRKRIRAIRKELEKKGWRSVGF